MAKVRLLQPFDAFSHWEHIRRIMAESGRDGDYIFSASETWDRPFEEFSKDYSMKFEKTVLDTGWEKVWVVSEGAEIFGTLKLTHFPAWSTSSLHRATLMMGIERRLRGQGFGTQMMSESLNWVRTQPSIDWVQLFVFEQNAPARKLYKKFGFEENGVTPDMFRVHGQKLTDISMILKLK